MGDLGVSQKNLGTLLGVPVVRIIVVWRVYTGVLPFGESLFPRIGNLLSCSRI